MTAIKSLCANFHADGRPRVWSLIVTIFGDSEKTTIPTADLAAILGDIGISDGAMRTALSRLSADGWVESERIGRTSHYRLSDGAREETRVARKTIYAPVTPIEWYIHLGAEAPIQALALARGGWIMPERPRHGPAARLEMGDGIGSLLPIETQSSAKKLLVDVALCFEITTAKDAHLAQVLLVHRWRRFALRHHDLPTNWFQPNSHHATLRAGFLDAYTYLRKCQEKDPPTGVEGS